jgi:F-type H+-transporting ATPase subunit delta
LLLSLDGASEDRLQKVESQLSALAALFDKRSGNPAFRQVVMSPRFSAAEKTAVLKDIGAAHQFDDVVQSFVMLLVHKERLLQLPAIAASVRTQVDEKLGRVRAMIVTAKPVDTRTLTEIVAGLEKKTGKRVLPEVAVDANVIAGVKATIGGVVYDATVRSQLDRMRSQFQVQ